MAQAKLSPRMAAQPLELRVVWLKGLLDDNVPCRKDNVAHTSTCTAQDYHPPKSEQHDKSA